LRLIRIFRSCGHSAQFAHATNVVFGIYGPKLHDATLEGEVGGLRVAQKEPVPAAFGYLGRAETEAESGTGRIKGGDYFTTR
jgi:hypothetical protein